MNTSSYTTSIQLPAVPCRLVTSAAWAAHRGLTKAVSLCILGFLGISGTALSATYWVTNTSGHTSTVGSLPWALQQANLNSNFDLIKFNIAGASSGSPATITLRQTLWINSQVAIDATVQPGYAAPFPAIVIDANGLNTAVYFQFENVSTLAGVSIINFRSNAVTVGNQSAGNWIRQNLLGVATYDQGVTYLKNNSPPYNRSLTRGVGIASSYNVLLDNTISGVDNGITIGDPIESTRSTAIKYRTNSFQFNKVGTDATGSFMVGNTSDGLFLGAGAGEQWIGPGNVFSGNASAGVELLHPSNIGNVIFQNMIGLDKDGSTAIPNGEVGVLISNGAYYNAVGGPWGGNVISANVLGGVVIGQANPAPGTTGYCNLTYVQNNIVGADCSGSLVVGSQNVGVSVEGGSNNTVVEGNIISGNATHGIQCFFATGNSFSWNWIGQTYHGAPLANSAGFGIFLSHSPGNYVMGNAYGTNGLGALGQQ